MYKCFINGKLFNYHPGHTGVSTITAIYDKEKFSWLKMRTTFASGCEHRYLDGCVVVCLFVRFLTAIVSSLKSSMTSPAMSF